MSATPCLLVNIPGPPGATGAAGANGTNGINAFTSVTVPFAIPAEGADVVVAVGESGWAAVGQKVFLGAAGAAKGTFQVTSVPGATSIVLNNIAVAASGLYLDNSALGTVFPVGTVVSPAGAQGPAGAAGAGGATANATYIVQTATGGGVLPLEQPLAPLATGLMGVTTGTGVVWSVPLGTSDGEVPQVDQAAGLQLGEVLFCAAAGIESKTAADTRTALGVGTLGLQAAGAVAITGGSIAATPISGAAGSFTTLAASTSASIAGLLATPPTALQTLAAANLIAVAGTKVRVVGNGGAVVMTSTPTIALGTIDGQELLVQGTSDVNTVQLQDDGSLAGSKLRLGAANRTLGAGDTIRFSWDSTLQFWLETSFTSLV